MSHPWTHPLGAAYCRSKLAVQRSWSLKARYELPERAIVMQLAIAVALEFGAYAFAYTDLWMKYPIDFFLCRMISCRTRGVAPNLMSSTKKRVVIVELNPLVPTLKVQPPVYLAPHLLRSSTIVRISMLFLVHRLLPLRSNTRNHR